MTYKIDSRSDESYNNQLKEIQDEINDIMKNIEDKNKMINEEFDEDNNKYKTEGFNNLLQLKRERRRHKNRSVNNKQLDGCKNVN